MSTVQIQANWAVTTMFRALFLSVVPVAFLMLISGQMGPALGVTLAVVGGFSAYVWSRSPRSGWEASPGRMRMTGLVFDRDVAGSLIRELRYSPSGNRAEMRLHGSKRLRVQVLGIRFDAQIEAPQHLADIEAANRLLQMPPAAEVDAPDNQLKLASPSLCDVAVALVVFAGLASTALLA